MNKKLPTLALDYGTKRVGVAISRGTLAEPLAILENSDTLIDQIKEICEQEKVGLILVGLSENKMAEKTKTFARRLEQQINLPIEFVDETLSSYKTHEKIKKSHIKKSKRAQPIDHYAAASFLEEWLETKVDN